MGDGDFVPTGHHAKKPLTRAQIKKLQQAYANAGAISEQVKELEREEQGEVEEETSKLLNLL